MTGSPFLGLTKRIIKAGSRNENGFQVERVTSPRLLFFLYFQPESYYHGTVNIGDTMAIGIQKYDAATKIEKLFYEST